METGRSAVDELRLSVRTVFRSKLVALEAMTQGILDVAVLVQDIGTPPTSQQPADIPSTLQPRRLELGGTSR